MYRVCECDGAVVIRHDTVCRREVPEEESGQGIRLEVQYSTEGSGCSSASSSCGLEEGLYHVLYIGHR